MSIWRSWPPAKVYCSDWHRHRQTFLFRSSTGALTAAELPWLGPLIAAISGLSRLDARGVGQLAGRSDGMVTAGRQRQVHRSRLSLDGRRRRRGIEQQRAQGDGLRGDASRLGEPRSNYACHGRELARSRLARPAYGPVGHLPVFGREDAKLHAARPLRALGRVSKPQQCSKCSDSTSTYATHTKAL